MTRAKDDERWLTPAVGAVGAASFFSDSGHEITTALLPTFLTSTPHGSAASLGLIDGFSDARVGVMQLVGGPLANDPHKRGRTASGGYLGTAVATGAIGLAATVWQAGALRAPAPVELFEFGNSATTLLILRATQLLTTPYRSITAATSLAILIYAGHNVIATFASLVAGRWYDRAGPRVVFAAGAAVYVIGHGLFAAGGNGVWLLVVAFGAAGAGIGLAEPTESAVVAQLLPDHLRGSGFGVLGVVQAAGDVIATVVAGVLYTLVSPAAAFACAAAWMFAAVLASGMLRRPAVPQFDSGAA